VSNNKSGNRRNIVRASVAAVLGTAVTWSYVPQVLAAEEEAAEEIEEVQITGSRIQRSDFVSPNPVTTFDTADLEHLGINNISDAITQVPQNVSQFTPANTGGSAFYVGSTLANLRGLNPFFGTRTLTLLDSRRFIPTTQGDAVDLNFVPSNLVKKIETVTGGASAAYGSGAISGVVNIFLDSKLQGIKIDADYGVTDADDGGNYRLGLAGGTDFAGGRGHVVLGGEYQDTNPIQSCADSRKWCAQGKGLFNNAGGFFFGGAGLPFSPKIPGQPHFVLVDGLRENQLSRGGVIFNGGTNATTAMQFTADGTDVLPFAIGTQGWRGTGGLVVGGDGDRAYTNLTMQPDVQRKTLFSHAEFDFTDNFTGYTELSWGQVEGLNNQFGSGQNATNNCINADNAFLGDLSPAARAALVAGNNNAPFSSTNNGICGNPFGFGIPGTVVSKNWQGQNLQVVTTDTKVTRGVLGFNAKLGDWSWDGYYQYGKTVRDQIGSGYRTNFRYSFAVDAVIDGAEGSPTFGQTMCRVTRDGVPNGVNPLLAVGCQPLNTFGVNSASPEALAYAFGSLTEHNIIRQDVFATSISGQLWEGWGAGPLSAAFGLEWRKDKLSNDAGDLPTALRTDFGLQYGDSFAGQTKVVEGFAEFEMPLLADLALADRLTLNAAIRTAQYKTDGSTAGAVGGSNKTDVTTWKLATVWDANDWLRIRGSHSRDIRAPNFRELFYSQTIPEGGFFGSVNNPWIIGALEPPGTTNADLTVWQLMGNTELNPEKAKTTTVGFVLTPTGALDGLQFSVDYYHIKLTGGLALSLGGPGAVTACFNGDAFFCDFLEFGTPRPSQASNPNAQFTNITAMKTLYTNQNPYIARGLDFALNYRLPASKLIESMPGNFLVNMAATHMLQQQAPVLGAGFVNYQAELAGQTGGDSGFLSDVAPAADWTGTLALTYMTGPFTGTLQTRYVAPGLMDQQNPKTGPDDPDYNPLVSYSASDNTTSSYMLFNLNGSYDLKAFGMERFQVFGSINNLLDKDPQFSSGSVGGVNAINYDTLGRTYRVGVRLKF
jgi:iron complex outermembrane receptor protein